MLVSYLGFSVLTVLLIIEFWNEMANLVNKILPPLFGNKVGFVNYSFRKQPIGKK